MADVNKSAPVAYLLALGTGLVGGHNFYLGRHVAGFVQLALTLLGLMFSPWLLKAALLWMLGDLIFMHKFLHRANKLDANAAEAETETTDDVAGVAIYNKHHASFQAAFDMGDMRGAPRHGTLALAALKAVVKGHPDAALATYLSNMGEICRILDDHPRARAYAEESVAMCRQLGLKTADENMALSINNLALICADMDDHAAAERLYKQVLAALPAGRATNDSVRLLNNLAMLYSQIGKHMEAELTLEKALAMAAKVSEMDSTLHTDLLNNYASKLMDRQAWDRSRTLYQQALAVQERACKGISRAAARSHNDLGVMAEKLGDLAAAQQHHGRALHLKQICVPDELLDIAESEHNLGGVYFAQGNFAQAAKMVTGLVETYTKVLGPTHPQTLQARTNLAAIPREYLTPQ
ncbi:MAG: tetratricopeptide repeat protein [Pseudomonadota bacterium]